MSRNELKLENLANTTRWNFDDQHTASLHHRVHIYLNEY